MHQGAPLVAATRGAKKANPQRTTALMYACQQGDERQVKEILKSQSLEILLATDRRGRNAVHYCAGALPGPSVPGGAACADRLTMASPALLDAADADGLTPLHLAVIAGNVRLVGFLLANGADVNALDAERHSVVHWATVCGETAALASVLSAGARVSTPDVHGGFPLHYAAQMCGSERSQNGGDGGRGEQLGLQVLHMLLSQPDASATVEDGAGRQPLVWAASAGSARAALALVRAGAPVHAADKDGLTALHCAASRGHTDCLDTLLTLCGAAPDTIDTNGCTALHYAVTLGHADATALLLGHGADPDRQDRRGRTAAHCGCAKGQLETVRLLGARRASLWLRNARGDLPLHEAAASGRRDLVRWLLDQRPGHVNARNNDGRCPLHLAALHDNADMCKILLDAGANVNPILRTSKNILMTPLDCALQRGFRSTAKLLQLHGGVPAARLPPPAPTVHLGVGSEVSARLPTSSNLHIREDITVYGSSSDEGASAPGGTKRRHRSVRRRVAYRYADKKEKPSQDDGLNRDTSDLEDNRPTDVSKTDRKAKQVSVSDESETETSNTNLRSKKTKERARKTKKGRDEIPDEDEGKNRSRAKERDVKEAKRKEKSIAEQTESADSVEKDSQEDEMDNVDKADLPISNTTETPKETEIEASTSKEQSQVINQNDVSVPDNGSEKESKSSESAKSTSREQLKSAKGKRKKTNSEEQKNADDNAHEPIQRTNSRQSTRELSKYGQKRQLSRALSQKHDSPEVKSPNEEAPSDEQPVYAQSVQNILEEEQRKTSDDKIISSSGESQITVKSVEILGNEPPISTPEGEDVKEKSIDGVPGLEHDSEDEVAKVVVVEAAVHTMPSVDVAEEANKGVTVVQTEDADKEVTVNAEDTDKEVTDSDKEDTVKTEGEVSVDKTEDADKQVTVEMKDMDKEVAKTDDLEGAGTVEGIKMDDLKEADKVVNVDDVDSGFGAQEDVPETEASTDAPETVLNDKTVDETINEVPTVSETDPPEINNTVAEANEQLPTTENKEKSPKLEKKSKSSELNIDLSMKKFEQELVDSDDVFKEDATSDKKKKRHKIGESKNATVKSASGSKSRSTSHESSSSETETRDVKKRRDSHKSFKVLNEDVAFEVIPDVLDKQTRRKQRPQDSPSSPEASTRRPLTLPALSDAQPEPAKSDSEAEAGGGGRRKRLRRRAQLRAAGSRSAGSGYDSAGLMDSGFEPSPRSSRIPKRKVISERGVNMTSVTQTIQGNVRRYHMERKIFQHLLELKRLQIRSGQTNEAVLVKRAIDAYHSSCVATVGAGRYTQKDFSYKSFEQFLYHSLRMLQKSSSKHLRDLPETADNPLLCTQSTHRCLHATHAYTGIPCAAYIPKLNHHTMPKIGFTPRSPSFLPQINSKGKAVTLELCHGNDKQVISLPADRLDQNKRYYVTFTVKGQESQSPVDTNASRNTTLHRHAKSV